MVRTNVLELQDAVRHEHIGDFQPDLPTVRISMLRSPWAKNAVLCLHHRNVLLDTKSSIAFFTRNVSILAAALQSSGGSPLSRIQPHLIKTVNPASALNTDGRETRAKPKTRSRFVPVFQW